MPLTLTARFTAEMDRLTGPDPPDALGAAVSGGGDSMALLVLLADWCGARGVRLATATVDHGIRTAAAEEAALVAGLAAKLGVRHEVLRWPDWDGRGNLQARARAARRRLLRDWANHSGVRAICLGHTRDDQAETVLMRLMRGSGVDGLAAMTGRRIDAEGTVWLRPLLPIDRSALRAELAARDVAWAEDPSNRDPRFDRVAARELLAGMGRSGRRMQRLAETAERMNAARQVLREAAAAAADRVAQVEDAEILFERGAFFALPDELQWRLAAAAAGRVSGAAYRPRLSALRAALAALRAGKRATLHGCLMRPGDHVRIGREPAALAGLAAPSPGIWDRRWRVEGPDGAPGLQARALDPEALSALPDWRDSGRARATLLASPGVWDGGRLVAAPLLGHGSGWSATPIWGFAEYRADLLPD